MKRTEAQKDEINNLPKLVNGKAWIWTQNTGSESLLLTTWHPASSQQKDE